MIFLLLAVGLTARRLRATRRGADYLCACVSAMIWLIIRRVVRPNLSTADCVILEHFEFRLVREALIEREVLLRAAPHIIWPMRFVLPYDKGLRPAWVLRMGLFLYDSLGGRELLPGTKTISLAKAPHKGVLEPRLKKGFEYSDCWVEDARLGRA